MAQHVLGRARYCVHRSAGTCASILNGQSAVNVESSVIACRSAAPRSAAASVPSSSGFDTRRAALEPATTTIVLGNHFAVEWGSSSLNQFNELHSRLSARCCCSCASAYPTMRLQLRTLLPTWCHHVPICADDAAALVHNESCKQHGTARGTKCAECPAALITTTASHPAPYVSFAISVTHTPTTASIH
jgi:hypothetical protein